MKRPAQSPGNLAALRLLALAATVLFGASCGLAPDETAATPNDEVTAERRALSACNAFGIPDPGTCSACAADASGVWRQTCVSADCTLYKRTCTAPIVSCGACTYRVLVGFVEVCTRADGSTVTRSCEPPRLPGLPPRAIAP